MSNQKEIDEFVAAEVAANEEKRAAFRDEQGYNPFIKWDQGSTKFTLMRELPRDHESFGKPAKVFQIKVLDTDFDWSVNPLSPMYMQTVAVLGKAPIDGTLTRIGEGLQTRYGLVWEGE